jgi:tetratricopeptide (TPR) repeat protein
LAAGAVLALNVASHSLEDTDPDLALSLNPLNDQARVKAAAAAIAEGKDAAAEPLLERGLAISPADARLYSLLGVIARREGDDEKAKALFGHALAQLPTEIQALLQQLSYALDARRFGDAIDHLELIARRWGTYWKEVEPALPLVLSDPEAFKLISQRFAPPRLRGPLLRSLIEGADTSAYAYDLVLAWHAAGEDVTREINQLTERFIRDGAYSRAFLLFKLTRAGDAASDGGFIHNGGFDRVPSGNAFDWTITNQTGVAMEIVERRRGEAAAKLLAVRFLDSPIRFNNVKQTLRLVAGSYRLKAVYSAEDLRMPRPIEIGIACLGGEMLAQGGFAEGDVRAGEVAFDFTVPSADCPLQQVTLFNQHVTESWKNRYGGTLFIDEIAIQAAVN